MRISKVFAVVIAVLSSAAAATMVVAAPAQAGPVVPIEGYVWGWQPASPSYTSSTGYEYDSAGGSVAITRTAAGSYRVRFTGMAGAGGVAHVSAYGASSVCVVSSWGPSGADEVINLRCFSAAGAPADSRFVAYVTNRTDGAARGYLWSSDPAPPPGGYLPPAQWSHDSTGQQIEVHPTGTGSYAVELGAFGQDIAGAWTTGSLRITAYGTSAVNCQIVDPAAIVADPQVLRVRCYDMTGSLVNSRFALSYVRGTVPTSATVDNYGLAPAVQGWSGSAPAVTVVSDGDYIVSFPGVGVAGGHAFATIMGTPPMYCNIHSWTVVAGAQNLRVRCYDPGSGALNPAMMVNVGFLKLP